MTYRFEGDHDIAHMEAVRSALLNLWETLGYSPRVRSENIPKVIAGDPESETVYYVYEPD